MTISTIFKCETNDIINYDRNIIKIVYFLCENVNAISKGHLSVIFYTISILQTIDVNKFFLYNLI